MTTGKQYKIETLEDIVQLDWRQREAFMHDLWHWLNVQDNIKAFNDELGQYGAKISSSGMVWCDDGVKGLSGLVINNEVHKFSDKEGI